MSQPPYQSDDTQAGSWDPPAPPGEFPTARMPSYPPPYAGQPYAGQPYGGQPYADQSYGGQPYESQPYAAQSYGTQSYGTQSYGTPPGGGWPEQPYGHPGYDPYGQPPRRGNGMAVAGFVLSFFFGLLGLIFSVIGLRRSREPGRTGRGLAIAGIVISVISMLVGVLVVARAVSTPTDMGSAPAASHASSSPARDSSPAPAPGSETVAQACHVIIPAVTGAQADLQAASSVTDALGKIDTLSVTVRQQGVATGDAAFTKDAARLADQYQALLHAAETDVKPDQAALWKAAEQIGFDCGRVGVTG